MNLKIGIRIEHEKTWRELCGGKLKPIIHYHLEKLKKDLEKYVGCKNINFDWYSSEDSDCNKCEFFKSEIPIEEILKKGNIDKELKFCALNRKNIKNSVLADFIWHKNCLFFEPKKKYKENLTYEELQNLYKELDNPTSLK